MNGLITDWLNLAEDYENSLNGRALVHTEAANASDQAYLDYLRTIGITALSKPSCLITRYTTTSVSNTPASPRWVTSVNLSTTVPRQESDTRTRLGILLAVSGIAIAAGCTTTSEGSPRPIPGTTTESSSGGEDPGGRELPYAGAPKVDDPLDTTQFQRDPCQALTDAQAQELKVTWPGKPRHGALGNACRWRSTTDRVAYVELSFFNENPEGLSATYQADQYGDYEFFNVLPPTEGHPAVSNDVVDDTDIGKCPVPVGASDEIAFELVAWLSHANVGHRDPCEAAATVAGMALRTMQEAA